MPHFSIRAAVFVLVAAASTACGYGQDTYADDMIDVTCAKYAECDMLDFFGGTEEACQNFQSAFYQGAEGDEETCPNYDAKSAKECVADWEAITCAQLEDGQTPAVCDSVCSAGSSGTEE